MSVTITKQSLISAAGLAALLLIGAPFAMSILDEKPELTGAWKERFQDVNKLNEYAKTQSVALSKVTIAQKDIDGAILNGGRFENTDWKEVSVKKATLTKTVFSKGILENVDFSNSTLTDVVFEDVTLWGARFFHTTLNNVRFVRCTFNGVNVDKTQASRIEVVNSRVVSTSFSEGQLAAVFRNSKLEKETELTDLIAPSSLTFEKSELDEVLMERSKLKELVINDSKFDVIFDVGSADTISIRNSVVDTSFSETIIGKLSVADSVITKMMFNGAKVNSMSFENCRRLQGIGMYQATIGTLDITRCPLNDFDIPETNITTLRIKDSSITESKFESVKAKIVILENVSLDGNLDFTGAHIGELKTKNVTKQPALNLITTGSNVKF